MDVFQTHFKPGSKARAGAAIRRHPASSQDTGILLPEDGLYFYSRLFYFLYRKLQLQQPKLGVWKSESPAGLRPKHPVKCSWHRVSAGSTLAGWVDRFVPPGNPLHLCGRGPQDRRQDTRTPDCSAQHHGKSMAFFLLLIISLWREFLTRRSQRRILNREQFWQGGVWVKGGLKGQQWPWGIFLLFVDLK